MEYEHTQSAPLHYLMYVVSAAMLTGAWALRQELAAFSIFGVMGVLMFGLGLSFKHLTVSDEGQSLRVQFGPLPVFGTRVAYADITSVKAARSSWIDGWGVHWVPGRGWTFNLWGFDCVEIHMGKRLLRIGTDDPQNLEKFLREKSRGIANS